MSRVIMQEVPIRLAELEKSDILTLMRRAQDLSQDGRFRGYINQVYVLEDKLVFTTQSDIFKHDNQEKNQLEKARKRAGLFLKELGIFQLGGKTATSRNLWELLWRPQIEYLMNNAVTDNLVDNHVAALLLMIPCIDRTFTFGFPQDETKGYTTKMLKWAFPEQDIGISTKDYKKCIKEMRDGLVNGLKHDSFLRGTVVIRNMDGNSLPFHVDRGTVVVNPSGFWRHVRTRIDGYYADKPRNPSIEP